MYILGKLKQWKTLELAPGASIRLLIASMDDARRAAILAGIEHLLDEVVTPAEGDQPERRESRPNEAWGVALHQAFGRECIRDWQGVGEQVDDTVSPLPCTPEHIDTLMADDRVATQVLTLINEVNARIVKETAAAGNA